MGEYEDGMAIRRKVLGDQHVDRATAAATDFDRDFQRWITESAWAGVWGRPGLDLRTRSLITIAILGALNHEELESLGALICDIRERLQVTVLLVEHHMSLVMGISDKVVALNFGKKIAEGTPAEVSSHPEVIRAYLGAEDEAEAMA